MKIKCRILSLVLIIAFFFSLTGTSFAADKTGNSFKSMHMKKGKATRGALKGRTGNIVSGARKSQSKWKDMESKIESKKETQKDLNQMQMLKLQNSVNRQNRATSTMSNMQKKNRDAQKNIINNLK